MFQIDPVCRSNIGNLEVNKSGRSSVLPACASALPCSSAGDNLGVELSRRQQAV
jgi:hypothetical protein